MYATWPFRNPFLSPFAIRRPVCLHILMERTQFTEYIGIYDGVW